MERIPKLAQGGTILPPRSEPTLAELIEVDYCMLDGERAGERIASLTIDGVRFPWYLGQDGVRLTVDEEIPAITITIPANQVTVDHRIESGEKS